MGALALLPSLVPAIGTVVKDVVDAVKGGATASSAQHDASAATGPTATTIAADPNFKNAVKHNQPNNAANAAAALVPTAAVKAGASKSLAGSSGLAKTLSAQLKATVSALEPCYKAEDYVFSMTQVMGKPALDADDKNLLTSLWAAVTQNVTLILGTTKSGFSELGDPGAVNAFKAILSWNTSPARVTLDSWVKQPGSSASGSMQSNVNNLWNWLNTATIVGTDTLSQIAEGLDKISQSQSD